MMIAVTDTMVSEDKFLYYDRWLRQSDAGVEVVRLSYLSENGKDLFDCSGLLLTGGNDVDPSLYQGQKDHPKIKDVDIKRDTFERKLIDEAVTRSLPVLAICRGMQLVNVHFGGTLISDLEDAGYDSHRGSKGEESRHDILIGGGKFLSGDTGIRSGNVNSSHHQAVDKVGSGLRVNARSGDGVIEGLECEDRINLDLIMVQWHPERMKDFENPLSKTILNHFLKKATHYTLTK